MRRIPKLISFEATVARLGTVLEPDGDPTEAEGILNPASARTRDGRLLLYPRAVARGNTSRIAIVEVDGSAATPSYRRVGFALEPREPYELRTAPGGFGCEDPRVTFVPALDAYLMAYTAYGPQGPRIACAISSDGFAWERLGLVDFSASGLPAGDDKDAAFFPEPVLSPLGVPSLAMYHRPMHHISAVDGCAAVPIILSLPPQSRESTRIAYIPLEPAMHDRANLLNVAESVVVLEPDQGWGRIKTGGGTPPVRVEEGWISFFHGVDGDFDANGRCRGMRYSAGIVVHDAERPHIVRYRSPAPVVAPETDNERRGTVNDVVFPTAIDSRPDRGRRDYDVYYGMADARVGRFRCTFGASVAAEDDLEPSGEESAA